MIIETTKSAEPKLTLWEVEVERKTVVYVLAESRQGAERIAELDLDISEELDGTPIVAWASEVAPGSPIDADDDELLYGADRDVTVSEWLASGGDIDGHRARKDAEAEAARVAWLAGTPADIRDLPAWHVARPSDLAVSTGYARAPWGFVLPDGRAGASDGFALIVVDRGNPPPCTREGWETPEQAERSVRAVLGRPSANAGSATTKAILDWLASRGEAPNVSIGPVTIDARLIDVWVRPVLPADGCVRVMWGDELDAVRFEGDGWTALVMPRRAAGEDRGQSLEVSHG